MPELRNITLGALFSESCARFGNRIAVEYMGTSATYAQVDALTDRLARGLMALGIKKGTRAAIWGNDRPNTLYCLLAMAKIGVVPVMLGTSLQKSELTDLLERSGAEYIFFDEGFRDISFPAVCRGLDIPALKECFYIGMESVEGFRTLSELEKLGESVPETALAAAEAAVEPGDTDMILFTSGTTSASKGVLTTHFSRANTVMAHIEALKATEEDKFCVAIPMFHCFSLTGSVLTAIMSGACVYFPANRHTKTLFEAIERDKITVLHAVPTLFSAMMARNNAGEYDISSLRTGVIGGAVYKPEFFERVSRELNYNLLSSLGQTEATAGFTFCGYDDPMEIKANTVGRFIEHTEGMIRNINTGKPQPVGEVGEICVRGFGVMQGYVGQPEVTAQTILPDGWLRTGDMGFIDENDCLHITGRLKDMIIRGGENISPGEIEELLLAGGKAAQVKVVAVPDEHYGEEICACVVLKDGEEMSEEEVRDIVRAKLAYFKVPRYVLFMEDIPKTNSGKVAIGKLRELARVELGL
ncbi:MAG: AMP-binding protein [Clostridiales bacterium]|nr:AMP-binding protein [Clostridiales bacterium]